MATLYEKLLTQMKQAKRDLNALAKKYDLKKKPQNVEELRDHQILKLQKHDEGNFHYYALAKDNMPVLLVSSAKNVAIDNDYHALVGSETKSPQMYGTFKIDRKAKVMTFTLDNNSKNDVRAKALVEKHPRVADQGSVYSLLEGLRFATGWKTLDEMQFQQSGLPGWQPARIFDCLWGMEELGYRSGNATWELFMTYSLYKGSPEGAFAGLVTEYKKSPTKERAVLLYDLFCVYTPPQIGSNSGDLSLNCEEKDLAPKNTKLVQAITDVKNGKTPPKDLFDAILKAVTFDKNAGQGPLAKLFLWFDPDAKLAQQLDPESAKPIKIEKTQAIIGWEAARDKLEKVGKFSIRNVK